MIYLPTSVDTPPEKLNWPDNIRLEMIEKSDFYSDPKIYQYGYYDGYQRMLKSLRPISEEKLREVMGNLWANANHFTAVESDRETSITNAIKALKDGK